MKKKTNKFEVVGYVDVDAGLIQVGDPCYQYSDHKDWIKFLTENKIIDQKIHSDNWEIPHNTGNLGKAILISSGMGDGTYPVEIKRDSYGMIKELRIKFF